MTPISDDMVELPRPLCTYADHSYPAFSKAQMIAYGQACATAALSGSVAVPEWQPIETAPKDGTEVDLWCTNVADGAGSRFAEMFFDEGQWTDWRSYRLEQKWKPTHWMHCPTGPAAPKPER